MTAFGNYALQFTNFTARSLAQSGADLLIVEAGVTAKAGQASLTTAELGSFAAQGRQVIGYVNTSVSDHARAYWQQSWVKPTAPDEPDVGQISKTAPAWLQNNLGMVDFAAEPAGQPAAAEAILVNYRDPLWRAQVVGEAVQVVQAGFHGVFLDDVGRYFEAGYAGGRYDPRLADQMMRLVIEVSKAVRAIDPDATVIVNSGVNIGDDSSAGANGALFARYRAAIDGVLIENLAETESAPAAQGVLSRAVKLYPDLAILPLENRASGLDIEAFLALCGRKGLLPYLAPDESYGRFAPAIEMGSAGKDNLRGAAGQAHLLAGLSGNDRLHGAGRADEIYGHAGQDTLRGAAGADFLAGGDGRDLLFGGRGADRLQGGKGADVLTGGGGQDQFIFAGASGHDRIKDFTLGKDSIDLRAYHTDFAAVLSATTTDATGLKLDLADLGGRGSLILLGLHSESLLHASDFIL